MKHILTAVLVALPALALTACGSSVGGDVGYTKDEAKAAGGVDPQGHDLCASEGWYDDGVCDDFCPQADGDCQASNQCPNEDDPHAHFVGHDASTCAAALFACPSGQISFYSPDCGCGCIDVADPAPMCGGIAGIACDAGFYCDYPAGTMCGAADQSGTCQPIPAACPEYYGPVCGCDGKTYDNPCIAHAAGVSVASDSACDGGGAFCGGFAGVPCGAGEFCNFTLGAVCGGGDQGGTCAPIPQACDQIYAPVCGCDGKTYPNECTANAAGVSILAQSACK